MRSTNHLMPEAEDAKPEVDEDRALCDERKSAHQVLHRDLHDRRQVEVRVVRHHDAIEQNRHYACQGQSKHAGSHVYYYAAFLIRGTCPFLKIQL